MGNRGKLREQQRARELRAHGWAMPDIAEELGVAKSSVSLWTRDVEIPETVPRRKRPRRKYGPNKLERRKQAEIEELAWIGKQEIGTLSERDLLITGTALYAGEGAKRDGGVRFANTDPAFIALFCRWLRHFFTIDESRLRVVLYLHADLDLDAAMTYWSHLTGVPFTRFGKPYRAPTDPTIRTAKHEFGCCTVRYSCSRTHRAVMGLVRALMSAPLTADLHGGSMLDRHDPG